MKRNIGVLLAVLGLLPLVAAAQVAVFKCEQDGRVIWSDNPCKAKGQVVKVKALQSANQSGSAADNRATAAKTPSPPPKSDAK